MEVKGEFDNLMIVEHAKNLKIITNGDFDKSGELSIALARAIKQTKANWSALVEKAKASYDETKASRDSELKPLEDMAGYVSNLRSDWMMEQGRLAQVEKARLEKIERDRAEKERQKLLERAVAAKTTEKAEALLEKAEAVYEKPCMVVPVVDKTTKLESGGSITWINDIEVTVSDPKALCKALGDGIVPISIVQFSGLKAWVKAACIKQGQIPGLKIQDKPRESKRV